MFISSLYYSQRLRILTTPYADTVARGAQNGVVVSDSGAVRLASAAHTPTEAAPATTPSNFATAPQLV